MPTATTYAALTLALEAETLRTALEICADIGETRVAVVARAALAPQEAKDE